MSNELWQTGLINWLLTYLLHSTILLGGVWMVTSLLSHRYDGIKESLWRVALLGGMLSASAQVCFHAPSFADALDLSSYLSNDTNPGEALEGARSPSHEPADALMAAPTAESTLVDQSSTSDGLASSTEAAPGGKATFQGYLNHARHRLAGAWKRILEFPARSAVFIAPVGTWVVLFMIIGSVLTILVSIRRMQRALSGRETILDHRPHRILAALRRRAGVRTAVRLTVTRHLGSPLALGLVRPEICLPRRAVDSMADAELESMLAHELAHIVRRDPHWMVLSHSLATLFFFQPLNFLARNRLRDLAEYQCDAWAAAQCNSAISLARCLTEVASWFVQARRSSAQAMVPGMSVHQATLSRRVGRLLEADSSELAGRKYVLLKLVLVPALLVAIVLTPGVDAIGRDGVDSVADLPPEVIPRSLTDSVPMPVPAGVLRPDVAPDAGASLIALDRELSLLEQEVAKLKQAVAGTELEGELEALISDFERKAAAIEARKRQLQVEYDLHLPDGSEPDRSR